MIIRYKVKAVYSISALYGDEEGNTEIVIRRALAKKGSLLDSSQSACPTTIFGFDVDTKEIVEKTKGWS